MLDVLYRLDRLPEEDTKVFAREFQTRPGGPALNAAVTHALLGGQGLLVSAVGGGPGAVVVRGELERHGIQLLDLAAGTAYETPLATAWVNSANGSRTVVNPPASDVKMRRLDGPWEAEVGTLWGEMPPVVLSDGDVVFQPRKIERAGIWNAVAGRVLIYTHKERALDHVVRRYPARHYVMVDDKPNLLAAMKLELGRKLTAVFVRQGHYASAAGSDLGTPPPDHVIQRIGDLPLLTNLQVDS